MPGAPVPEALSHAVRDAPGTRTLLRASVEEATALLRADGGLIYLVDADGETLRLTEDAGVTIGPSRSWARGLRIPVGSGMFGLAVEERRVVATSDYPADTTFVHTPDADRVVAEADIRSMIVAPLAAGEVILGALGVFSHRLAAFGDADTALVRALAFHAAATLANTALIDELARSREQLARRVSGERGLREIAARLAAIRNPAELLQEAVEAAARLAGADWAEIARVEPDGAITWTHDSGIPGNGLREALRAVKVRVGEGLLGSAVRERRVMVTDDYLADTSFPHIAASDAFARRAGFRSLVAAPLVTNSEVVGVLAVHSARPAAFDADDVALIAAFADNAAVAMGNARLIEALDLSESRYRGLLGASPDIVFSVDGAGMFTFISDTVERLLDRPPAEVIGRHFSAIIDADSMGDALQRWRDLRETPGVVLSARFNLIHRDGRRIPFEIRSSGLEIEGRFAGVQGSARDVSDRDRLERELRESEERYREIVAATPDLIWEVDAAGRFTFVSATVRQLIDFSPEEMLGRDFRTILHASTYDDALAAWAVVVGAPNEVHGSRFSLRHRDGRAVPIENYSIGRVAGGEFAGAHGAARDVRERERLELELRASEAQYRYLVENSPDIVWSADADGLITYLSDTSERVLGWRPDEAVGKHFSLLIHPDSLEYVSSQYAASLAGAGARDLRYRFDGQHRNGSRVPLEMHARTIVEDGVYRGSHGAVRDLRDRERLERDLRRQAAEIASSEERAHLARELHDSVTQALFSMTLVTRSIELLLDRDVAEAKSKLETLRELQSDALAEMRALIFELRPASLETEGLVRALRTHAAAIQGRTGLLILIDTDEDERLPSEIESALFRIAQEALHNVIKHAAARQVRISLERTSGRVSLSVEDDGGGFDPARVAEGHLGLAGMRARAEKLAGTFAVASDPGRGTSIRVEIPLPPPGTEKPDGPPAGLEAVAVESDAGARSSDAPLGLDLGAATPDRARRGG